jgi:uncharacterized protein (TIGR00369 family)
MKPEQSSKVQNFRSELTLNFMQNRFNGCLPGLIGVELVSISPGIVSSRLKVRPDFKGPNGFLHAATVICLADTTCGSGAFLHLPEGAESFTTIEIKTNFMSSVREGVITCEARLEHSGGTLQLWDAEIRSEATDQRLALFRCTQLVLWPRVRATRPK